MNTWNKRTPANRYYILIVVVAVVTSARPAPATAITQELTVLQSVPALSYCSFQHISHHYRYSYDSALQKRTYHTELQHKARCRATLSIRSRRTRLRPHVIRYDSTLTLQQCSFSTLQIQYNVRMSTMLPSHSYCT